MLGKKPKKITIEFEDQISVLNEDESTEFLELFESLITTTEDAIIYLMLLNDSSNKKLS